MTDAAIGYPLLPAPEDSAAASAPSLPFEFRATASEYFGIWIVNLCLTVLTLGIYSAWAKVRRKRYFYGCTSLAGGSFEYLARPIAILKGRLIAFALFAAYLLLSYFQPGAGIAFYLVLFLAIPWVVVRALMFNAYNSAYRNIRFGFRPAYADSYAAYVGWPLLIPFTLGLIYPFVKLQQKRFAVNNHRYGGTPFKLHARGGDFYVTYILAALLMIVCMIPLAAVGVAASVAFATLGKASAQHFDWLPIAVLVLFYLGFFLTWAYLYVTITNLVWNNAALGLHHFRSTLKTMKFVGIMLTNLVAIACSAGLLIPWASVRLARYRLSCMAVMPGADWDVFTASATQGTGAAGEEVSEWFAIDIGI
jgi:uncharacterized membrane protein YjgN (DUF898 family)